MNLYLQEILKIKVIQSSDAGLDSPTANNMMQASASPRDGIINQTLKDTNGNTTLKHGASGGNTPSIDGLNTPDRSNLTSRLLSTNKVVHEAGGSQLSHSGSHMDENANVAE